MNTEDRQFSVRSLAMLAGALSRKYNVTVQSGGTTAYTSPRADGGVVINIPSVEIEDANYKTLIRGYIDHETGHNTATEWVVWQECSALGPFYKSIANIYEDAFVEKRMGQCYAGCGRNLMELNTLLFGTQYEPAADSDGVPARIARYLLWSVIGRTNGNVQRHVRQRRDELEAVLPGLADALDPLVDEAQHINSTRDTYELTKKTKALLQQWLKDNPQPQSGQDDGSADGDELQQAVNGGDTDTSGYGTDIGQRVQEAISGDKDLQQALQDYDCRLQQHTTGVGGRGDASFGVLPEDRASEALRVAGALSVQLQALLQHRILNREGRSRQGRLDFHKLHRLTVNDPRVFRRRVEKFKLNTEVIVLADASGSMGGEKARVTSEAMYALASSMRMLPGVRSAVYAFHDRDFTKILGFDELLTRERFFMRDPDGNTPGGAGLHYALQQFSADNTKRRICIVLTDGAIDDEELWRVNAAAAEQHGIELLGVGIMDRHITSLLHDGECEVVSNLDELAPALFRMLQRRLV